MRRCVVALAVPLLLLPLSLAGGPPAESKDSRLGKPKAYEGYFPWTPPTSKEAWDQRKVRLREQVLVANGLWPLPAKTPLNPVIHGKIDRDDYTIEKVFFASMPGHYVTGNLYKPKGKTGKLPAVLFAHGHWNNGRLHDAGEKAAQADVKSGAEKTIESARFFMQAPCAQLARMGCVVFIYDMVGVADSKPIPHRAGFTDAEAELRLQSFMGLQTWNSIRCLDFVTSLPDVDPAHIGITGASGGGTQSFILAAVDERVTAAVPAVMVSTGMQGGCICENASLLRVETGNIELAALIAPRPQALISANDWTKEIEKKGLPELKALYKLVGAEEKLASQALLKFGHNYNQLNREFMYGFFNMHLKLGQKEPIAEKPFVPVPPAQLSVFDAKHPQPKDALNADGLRRNMTATTEKQMEALFPKDAKGLEEFRRVYGGALRAMVTDELPAASDVEEVKKGEREDKGDLALRRFILSRKGKKESVPVLGVRGKEFDGTVVVWVHPDGLGSLWDKDKLVPAARALIDKKAAILAVEAFGTGGTKAAANPAVNKGYPGYTFGYNRSLLANRVHDILTAISFARNDDRVKKVAVVGLDKAGPWVVLASALCGKSVDRTAADLDQFRFEQIGTINHDMLLPGALRYGGIPALSALIAPGELYLHNTRGAGSDRWQRAAYEASASGGRLVRQEAQSTPEDVAKWLTR